MNTKYTRILFSAPIFLLSLTGCVDLDQLPIDSIVVENFYSSATDVETAINGIYDEFTEDGFYGLYNNGGIYLGDLATEYVKAGANTNSAHIREIGNEAIQPTNIFTQYAWNNSYKGINRANLVIDKVENSSFSDEDKKRYVGEAKILRAIHYFNLVRWYGEVPIVLHDGEGNNEPRNSVDEVYKQIVADLESGTQLPSDLAGGSDGHVTRGTALGILSKVYLTWAQTESELGTNNANENYKKTIEYADKVTALGHYSLEEEFLNNWAVNNKNGKESLFQIQHENLNNVTGHCTFAMGWSDSEPVLILQNTVPYDRFDDRDQRKHGSFAKTLYNPNTGEDFTFKVPLFRKYIDTLNYAANQYAGRNTNNSYLRYAEVLLIKAEAENELNGPTAIAYEAINQVRRRGYKHFPVSQPSGDDLPSGLSKEQFRWALQRERFNELVLEGQHWFDLVRWHILVKTVKTGGDVTLSSKTGITERNYRLPIPQDQIDQNPNLTQNWGYNGETSGSPYAGWEDKYTSALVNWTSQDSPLIGY